MKRDTGKKVSLEAEKTNRGILVFWLDFPLSYFLVLVQKWILVGKYGCSAFPSSYQSSRNKNLFLEYSVSFSTYQNMYKVFRRGCVSTLQVNKSKHDVHLSKLLFTVPEGWVILCLHWGTGVMSVRSQECNQVVKMPWNNCKFSGIVTCRVLETFI